MNCPRRHICWQSKRLYWERPAGRRAVGKGTQENCSAAWLAILGFMVMALVSGLSLADFWLRVLPGGARLVQPSWMPASRILEGGWTCGVSFRPLPNSSGWWWCISSVCLTRTSCHKTAHANVTMVPGQGGRFVTVLPLAAWHEKMIMRLFTGTVLGFKTASSLTIFVNLGKLHVFSSF